MRKLTTTSPSYWLVFFFVSAICIVGFPSTSYASLTDTTTFRIKVLQDSVYAGDTVDVEFYIGNGSGTLLNNLNLLNEFEMEVATDTALILQDRTQIAFDQASLARFFNTSFSNIASSITLDPVSGKSDMKAKSAKNGKGEARVAKGRYIVQDNAAGRQQMRYNFTKSVSKSLLQINPVKLVTDSVLILGRRSQKEGTPIIKRPEYATYRTASKNSDWNNEIKVYPNPTLDYIQIEGTQINQYKLMSIEGSTILSEIKPSSETLQLNMHSLNPGMYILMLRVDEDWNSYKIIKK